MLRFFVIALAAAVFAFALSVGAALATEEPAREDARGPVHQFICVLR
jgi:hypothetical protein